MPSWRVHRYFAREMLSYLGLPYREDQAALVDRLVDIPDPLVLEGGVWRGAGARVLLEVLSDPELRPEEPVMRHDWGLRAPNRASLEALRRACEALVGEVGALLADLHVSLDAVEVLGLSREGYEKWAEEAGVDARVRGFLLSRWELVERSLGRLSRR